MSGLQFGLVVGMPFTGALTDFFGWEIQFYISAGLSLAWLPLWFWYARDHPAQMPEHLITRDERDFLAQFTFERSNAPIPWINFCFSLPDWGLLVAWFGHNYVMYSLLTALPVYLTNVHGTNALESGVLGILPYLLK